MAKAARIGRVVKAAKLLEEAHLEDALAAIRQARQTLADYPCPDTFLGRRTHEPFASEKDLQVNLS